MLSESLPSKVSEGVGRGILPKLRGSENLGLLEDLTLQLSGTTRKAEVLQKLPTGE